MRYALPSLSALGLLAATGCTGEPASPATDGPGFTVAVAPLDLPGIGFACYDLLLENGATPRETVISRGTVGQRLTEGDATTLCSTRFGNSAGGDIAYVAPCDASQPAHAVTLWVDGLYSGTPEAATLMDFQDPCPDGCTLTATCAENADTPVNFNLTIMRPANQGFFDVAVNFQNVFCSAKVDCEYSPGEPIRLLHNPASREREQTVVVALACTAGPGSPTGGTVLLRDPITIDCAGADPIVLDPTLGEGNVYGPIMDDPDLDDAVWQYATYFGAESLPCGGQSCDKRYWNVAIGLDTAAAGCTLTTTAAASGANIISGFTTPEASTYPVITHTVPLTGASGGLLCSQHPLNGEPGGVSTTYTLIDGPHTFCHRYDGTFSTDDSGDCGEVITPACWEPPTPNCPDGTWVYEGNMVIAASSSGGEVHAPPEGYECIESITGNLVFERPNGGTSWDGALEFTALESIGGDLWFVPPEPDTHVLDASFPNLTTIAGELAFFSANSTIIDLPSLSTVGGDFIINNLSVPRTFDFPSITSIGGVVTLTGNSGAVTVNFGETRTGCEGTEDIEANMVALSGSSGLSLNVVANTLAITTDLVFSANHGSATLEATGAVAAQRVGVTDSHDPRLLIGGNLIAAELLVGTINPNAAVTIETGGGLTVTDTMTFSGTTGNARLHAAGASTITPRLNVESNGSLDIDLASPTTLGNGLLLAGNGNSGGGSVSIGVQSLPVDEDSALPGIGIFANNELDVTFPALGTITWTEDDPTLQGLMQVASNTALSLAAPALTTASGGRLEFANNGGPLTLNFPGLTTTHSFIVVGNANLTASTLDLSSLATATEEVVINNNAALSTCFIEDLLDGIASPFKTYTGNLDDTDQCP